MKTLRQVIAENRLEDEWFYVIEHGIEPGLNPTVKLSEVKCHADLKPISYFAGICEYKNGELKSCDDDSYSLDEKYDFIFVSDSYSGGHIVDAYCYGGSR